MYKVLLVDDERIILDGISQFVDWPKLGTELIGTAKNGLEALDIILQQEPDIVITDILMPGLDGLQLIARVREMEIPVQFVMLTGFSDFDYARQAMRFGVKEYLLKPCNEEMIEKVIREIIEEKERMKNKERFMERLEVELKTVLPHAKEQLFKEFVTNKTYGRRDWEQYRDLLGFPSLNANVRLILFELEDSHEFEHLFALKNIAMDIFGQDLLLSTTIGSQVLLLVQDPGDEHYRDRLLGQIDEIKRTFYDYYRIDSSIALSDSDGVQHARRMYRDTLACLNHRFYLAEGSLITKQDIMDQDVEEPDELDISFDEDRLTMLIKAGRTEDVLREVQEYFDKLAVYRLDAGMAKTYVITLYLSIIRQSPASINHLMEEIMKLDGIHTLSGLQAVVELSASEITSRYYESNRHKHSAIIQRVIDILHDNLGNPELSLNSVANDILYMNPDYLGKLFKKETGEKFSNYVTKLRMEKAIEMMNASGDVKIFEIAQSIGYGDNPQYFSKVFKKYTGFTPSEFKAP